MSKNYLDTEIYGQPLLLELGNSESKELVIYHTEYSMYQETKSWLDENRIDDTYVKATAIETAVQYVFEKSDLALMFKLRFEPQEGRYKTFLDKMLEQMAESLNEELYQTALERLLTTKNNRV